jgi:hypothetical protein
MQGYRGGGLLVLLLPLLLLLLPPQCRLSALCHTSTLLQLSSHQ